VAAVEVAGLRKVYRGGLRRRERRALDGMDLTVAPGEVHGFLGPNGSGKTTTLRILLGLVKPDAGEVRLLGRPVPSELAAVVPEIGSVVEAPRFFPSFSGRRNLDLLARVAGLEPARVDEALEIVGLTDRARDKVKAYSLGMRQRLGIAQALMKRPRLLLLDEPTNGLDPAGIREVRRLMAHLASTGVTVLLSSHLLSEVQQICTSVTIVAEGRSVRTGTVDAVLAGGSAVRVRLKVSDPAAATAVLAEGGLAVAQQDGWLMVSGAVPSEVNRLLGERGIWADELGPDHADLEDVFLSLTQASQAPEEVPPA
jgi:ABC-2 type transport system ATP-binding protein